MKYTFIDGSGNKYTLYNQILSYSPIKPRQSSSGIYDGGDPFERTLSKMDVLKLIDVFERSIWSDQDHSATRLMGCGTLLKELGGQSSSIYIKMNSNSLKEIEEKLASISS